MSLWRNSVVVPLAHIVVAAVAAICSALRAQRIHTVQLGGPPTMGIQKKRVAAVATMSSNNSNNTNSKTKALLPTTPYLMTYPTSRHRF